MKGCGMAIALVAVLSAPLAGQGVRPAEFAGSFYPAEPAKLTASIEALLSAAGPPPRLPGRLIGLIAPHAGYVYSGRTAAAAYAQAKGRKVEAVVIIGPAHRWPLEGCSIWSKGGFETPLGLARVDERLASEICRASGFGFEPRAFAGEHSVEVHVPFVQAVLPGIPIVPIVMGRPSASTVRRLAVSLAKTCLDRDILVVASTDMSHYLPKAEAAATDARTIALIKSLDVAGIVRRSEDGENIMCGGGPVAALLLLAEKAGRPRVEVLDRSDSSAAGGPVVGYLAAAVLSGPAEEPEKGGAFALTKEEKAALLRLARRAIEAALDPDAVLLPEADGSGALAERRGAFVTLRKGGQLRGCIGFIEPLLPLGRAVVQAAVLAATEDPRFPPLDRSELVGLTIEISVLTPLQDIANPRQVVVGRHGLVVSQGDRRGLLLPQVPVENGWGRETFLAEACLKAGLPPDAWRRGAKLAVFEAIVFHE